MKTAFLLLATLCFSTTLLFADPWEDMTREEAQEVVDHLEKNPFILDYCDCCDGMEVTLFRVTSAEIIPCSWKPEAFSVNAKVQMVAFVGRTDDDLDLKTVRLPEEEDYFNIAEELILSMNYTFTWDSQMNRAAPFFDVVKYASYNSIKKPCNNYTDFPAPEKLIEDKDYIAWYYRRNK